MTDSRMETALRMAKAAEEFDLGYLRLDVGAGTGTDEERDYLNWALDLAAAECKRALDVEAGRLVPPGLYLCQVKARTERGTSEVITSIAVAY